MKITNKFERLVLSSVTRYGMVNKDDSILVALSGGADSVSLLLCLNSIFGKERLAACHVNHMIRGEDADSDELFCKKLCESLDIRFFSTRVDIPALCKEQGKSAETVARDERYKFFSSLCALYGFSRIATAHTLSDNAETLIFNICRGANTDGLCGIPPVRDNIIRPLCDVTRQDVEDYLKEKKQGFCHDKTNDSDDYTRNLIRHNIIPQLKRINPSFEHTAKRLCDSARDDKLFFDSHICKELSLAEIDALPEALKTRYVRDMCKGRFGDSFFLSAVQTSDICREIGAVSQGLKKASVLSLCDRKYMKISDGTLLFCDENDLKSDENPTDFDYFLHDGENIINEKYAILLSHTTVTQKTPDFLRNGNIVYNLYKQIKIPSDIISGSLRARSRLFGDSYRAGGMTRKLKRMLIDKKLTAEEKNSIPVICDDDGILFVPGFPVPDKAADDGDVLIAVYKDNSSRSDITVK